MVSSTVDPVPDAPVRASSNGVPIPPGQFTRMTDSSALRDDPDSLRARFTADGYVLLRGVLDRTAALALRADYFARFDTDGPIPEYGTAGHPAYDLVRAPIYDAFTRAPELATVAGSLLGGPAQLLPRRILRHFSADAARASRAHVDFDYMDRGGEQVVTAWVPLGDYPGECGGLVYLSGSHRVPHAELDQLREHTDRPGDQRPVSNDLALTADTLGGRWLWTEFGAGDVVLHSPHTVHASLDNHSPVMRLSTDLRFRRTDAEPDARWAAAWSADDGF